MIYIVESDDLHLERQEDILWFNLLRNLPGEPLRPAAARYYEALWQFNVLQTQASRECDADRAANPETQSETTMRLLFERATLCEDAPALHELPASAAPQIHVNLIGLWLLIPEHLRLGTWDLLCGWSGQPGQRVEPRLALQLSHEAALCSTGVRQQRSLSQRGFELANGLPFVASDVAIHSLLAEHTVAQSQRLQVVLGQIRRASGDYAGKLLAIDPHRVQSYSKRQMRRFREDQRSKPFKVAQAVLHQLRRRLGETCQQNVRTDGREICRQNNSQGRNKSSVRGDKRLLANGIKRCPPCG